LATHYWFWAACEAWVGRAKRFFRHSKAAGLAVCLQRPATAVRFLARATGASRAFADNDSSRTSLRFAHKLGQDPGQSLLFAHVHHKHDVVRHGRRFAEDARARSRIPDTEVASVQSIFREAGSTSRVGSAVVCRWALCEAGVGRAERFFRHSKHAGLAACNLRSATNWFWALCEAGVGRAKRFHRHSKHAGLAAGNLRSATNWFWAACEAGVGRAKRILRHSKHAGLAACNLRSATHSLFRASRASRASGASRFTLDCRVTMSSFSMAS